MKQSDAEQQEIRDAIIRLNFRNDGTRSLAKEVEKELAKATGLEVASLDKQ